MCKGKLRTAGGGACPLLGPRRPASFPGSRARPVVGHAGWYFAVRPGSNNPRCRRDHPGVVGAAGPLQGAGDGGTPGDRAIRRGSPHCHIRDLRLALEDALVVFVALALSPETEHIIGPAELAVMREDAWLVNVARGRHVDTPALVKALQEERIGGAAVDVTDPEPLPDGHPLWTMPNCLITPHSADTPEMCRPLLAERIRENVQRFASGRPLVGTVDLAAGY